MEPLQTRLLIVLDMYLSLCTSRHMTISFARMTVFGFAICLCSFIGIINIVNSYCVLSDMNGDGIDDIAISCEGESHDSLGYVGSVYVLYGNSSLASLPVMNGGSLFVLSQQVNGQNGFRIKGPSFQGTMLGFSWTTCDFNGKKM